MMTIKSNMRFPLGQVVITPGVQQALSDIEVLRGLMMHVEVNWKEACEGVRDLNDDSLVPDELLMSMFRTPKGIRFWIITELDHSVTTVLLPEEH